MSITLIKNGVVATADDREVIINFKHVVFAEINRKENAMSLTTIEGSEYTLRDEQISKLFNHYVEYIKTQDKQNEVQTIREVDTTGWRFYYPADPHCPFKVTCNTDTKTL